MIRKALFSISLLSAGLCIAAPLTPEEALSRLDNSEGGPATRGIVASKPALTISTKVGEPALYLFEKNESTGFMVVSADDAIIPLLGYSDNAVFDGDNMPPAMQTWLDQYTRQIEFVRENGLTRSGDEQTRVSLPGWSAIAPLLKTTWNQNAPYNNACPLANGRATNTGCVATSMAQVMNYFKFPEKGQDKTITYNCESLGRTLSLNFSTVTFDWTNMLNSYSGEYNKAQADAVANLMMAAGYSVRMNYSAGTSGAVSGYIPGALYNYFGYDKGVYYMSRSMQTYTEWATLIYNNLKNVGPVIYDGNTAESAGHSFVCDGYNGNGYFHFNWGWGGAGDGYFLLDSLDPSAIGIGGALGGFDYEQDIVLNIRKPQGDNNNAPEGRIIMSGTMEGYTSSSYLYMKITGASQPGFRYYGLSDMTFEIGLEFTPENGGASIYESCSNNKSYFQKHFMPLTPGYIIYMNGIDYIYPNFILSRLNLQDNVKYKATAVYLPEGQDKWQEIQAGVGDFNYFYITKKGNSYEFENMAPLQFGCSNISLESGLYYKKAVEAKMTLVNNSNTELTRSAILVLVDERDRVQFMGESIVESLSPGESKTLDYVTSLTQMFNGSFNAPQDYYLGLYDLDSQTLYYKSPQTVTMQANPGDAIYTCDLWIDNGTLIEGGIYEGVNYDADLYMVENAQNIQATCRINVEAGIFSSPINIYGAELQAQGIMPQMTYPLELKIINAGQSDTYQVKINYSSAVPGQVYFIVADVDADYNIDVGGKDNLVGFVAQTNSGVEEVAAALDKILMLYSRPDSKLNVLGNGIRSVEVYSLNGMKLAPAVEYTGDNAVVDLSSLGKGIVMVTAVDRQGNRKSVKLAL